MRISVAKEEPVNFQKKTVVRIGSNKTGLRNFSNYVKIIYNSQKD